MKLLIKIFALVAILALTGLVNLSAQQTDKSDAVWSIVLPAPASFDVDMQKQEVGKSKDSVITELIQNKGAWKFRVDSIFFTGADADCFRIVSGTTKYIVPGNANLDIELRFIPKHTGSHIAQLVIITQTDTLIHNITGYGVQAQLQALAKLLNFGQLELGDEKTISDTLVVKNVGTSSINITKTVLTGPDADQFQILSNSAPFTLGVGAEHAISVKFKPKFGGRTSSGVGFEFEGIGSPFVVGLYGTGIGGLITIPTDSAYSGDKFNLKLKLEKINPAGLQAMAKSFSADLKFQGRILAPQDFAKVTLFANDSITMHINGDLPNDVNIISIPMLAGLGNVEETLIEISNFTLYDFSGVPIDYNMDLSAGVFKLIGICRAGGSRLINPNSQAQIQSINPNPASETINVIYQLTEKGYTELSLVNELGETVKQISYGEISDYSQRLETIKLDELANGRYTLILKTPTISERRSVLIIR